MTANRLAPDGTFTALPRRGQFMGNRGCLHDASGAIRRRHAGKLWITCTLRPKPSRGKVAQSTPGRYTPLFFLDEAVAAAAGHRPCAECRRAAYNDFRYAWTRAFGQTEKAAAVDNRLHAARFDRKTRQPVRHIADLSTLPFGSFIVLHGQPHLVQEEALCPWHPEGYAPAIAKPAGLVTVLTPEPVVQVMRAGWRPLLSAQDDRPSW